MSKLLPLFFSILLLACSGETESIEDVDIEHEMDELSEELMGPIWAIRTDGEFFEIELPTQMEQTDRLNADASLQFRFVNITDTDTLEHFIIVMTEDIPDEKMKEVDLPGFTEAYLDSLMGDRPFEVINEPSVESINDMETIIHEFTSSFIVELEEGKEQIDLYYMFGVFKGEKALYQVLTWTLGDQKEIFRSDMKHILYSFKEIK